MKVVVCLFVAAAALLAVHPRSAHAQARTKAAVSCVSTGKMLEYDCTIKLANLRSGEPISGVTVSVGADMPSMPGMHSVRPAKATEGSEKGVYQVRLVLEMHGDWAVQLDLSGAMRDRVISMLRFEGAEVTDVKPAAPARRRH
jgi:hypothetical protein